MGTIPRNDVCPCGSFKKYKKCCHGKTDWDVLLRQGNQSQIIRNLRIRGRNIAFINRLCDILSLDKIGPAPKWSTIKEMVNENHVRDIHEAILSFWPTKDDYVDVLEKEKGGFFCVHTGSYEVEDLLVSVTRHAIYSNSILLFDPFVYSVVMRDEFNPILNPGKFITHTLKCLYFWFSLAPWIHQGIVGVIRSPVDYDPQLMFSTGEKAKQMLAGHKELQEIFDAETIELGTKMNEVKSFLMLLKSEESFIEYVRKERPSISEKEMEQYRLFIAKKRQEHPFYSESFYNQVQAVTGYSTGANFFVANIVANHVSGHLITDSKYRWGEYQIAKDETNVETQTWSPMAFAIQKSEFPFFKNISLEPILKIRQNGFLLNLRRFFHEVWTKVDSQKGVNEKEVYEFTLELEGQVAKAREEWKEMQRNLLKIIGISTLPSLVVGLPEIINGNALFGAGAIATGASMNLFFHMWDKRNLKNKLPALLLMNGK